jgi:hypothetical protein
MKAPLVTLIICWSLVSKGQGTNCSNAFDLPIDTVCHSFPVSPVTGSCDFCTMNGYNGNNGHITYFKFTTDAATRCVLIDITAAAGVTMELVLYNQCNSGITSPAGGLYNHNMCMNDGAGLWAQNLFDNLQPNTTYYLKARTAGGFNGNMQVCAKYYTPPNMDCYGATSISSNVYVKDNNACHRPGNIIPSQLCAITLENTAWYTYVIQATGSSTITIDSIACNNGNGNNNNGFQIGFFSGDCNGLIPITCSNGAGGTVQATATGLTGGTRVYVAIDGYSGSNCSYSITATNSYPMPVKLQSFTAWKDGSRNKLKWVSLEELDNDHYEVQRSVDARDFQEIGRVTGNNNSTTAQNYNFYDEFPEARSYYRLKQVDRDGKFSFSPIVEVKRKEAHSLQLLPVTVSDGKMNLRFKSSRDVKCALVIYSANGEVIETGWIFINKGEAQSEKDIRRLPAGSYIITLIAGDEKISRVFTRS